MSKLFLPLFLIFAQAGFCASTQTIDIKACFDGQTLLIIHGDSLQWHNLQFFAPGLHAECPAGSIPNTFISTTSNGAPVLTNLPWTASWPDGTFGDQFSSIFTGLSPALTPPAPGLTQDVSLTVIQARGALSIDQLPTLANDYTLILNFNDASEGGPAVYEALVTITNNQTAAPVFTPKPGTYAWTMKVAIAAAPDSVIHYTLDGSMPTAASTTFVAPITVGWETKIEAVAISASSGTSAVATGDYTIDRPMEAPLFDLPGGTYTAPQTVALSDNPSYCSHAICVIYYTLDGSTPTTHSAKYTGPITLDTPGTTSIKAIATSHHFTASPVASSTYSLQ